MPGYLKSNIFLADINNEHQVKNKEYATNLASLDKFIMVMFNDDRVVSPKESAWFGFYDKGVNGKVGIVNLRDQLMYIEDWIGLRGLDEQGKLEFLETPGDHVRCSLYYDYTYCFRCAYLWIILEMKYS